MRELNDKEQKAVDLTVELWTALQDLEVIHRQDLEEMALSIHDIQARVMSRPIRESQ